MSSIPPTAYDPRRIVITFGVVPLLGLAPGRFVTIRRDAATWSTADGTNGEFKRIRSRKKSGTVEVILRGTAPVNRLLSVLAKIDERNGGIFAPLAVTDTLNGGFFFAKDSYIERMPEMVYSKDEGDIAWKFICPDLDMTFPGLSLETVIRLQSV